jgi:dTDP-glucose pyrophosphorylase
MLQFAARRAAMKPTAKYESEITKFIRELLERKPELREEQKKARALWWDKQLDLDALERSRESSVPREGYVYYDNSRPAASGTPEA